MPRTKNARKSKQGKQQAEENDLLVRDFKRMADLRISKMERESRMSIESIETLIDVALSRLPPAIRQLSLNEILNDEANCDKENCNEVSSSIDDCTLPSTLTTVKGKKKRTTASDDGYVTEGRPTTRLSRAPKSTEPTTGRRTRSSSRNSRMKLSEINEEVTKKIGKKQQNQESIRANRFKTPAPLKPMANSFGLVTPKIKPNTPLNVLRRPRQGEMVLSMQGSPLLVSAVIQEDTANINVPLRNGNVISLLPNEGLRMSHIPSLDEETKRQLETLKNHLEKVVSAK